MLTHSLPICNNLNTVLPRNFYMPIFFFIFSKLFFIGPQFLFYEFIYNSKTRIERMRSSECVIKAQEIPIAFCRSVNSIDESCWHQKQTGSIESRIHSNRCFLKSNRKPDFIGNGIGRNRRPIYSNLIEERNIFRSDVSSHESPNPFFHFLSSLCVPYIRSIR